MRFLVVGHLCRDVIHLPDGQEVRGYGGIYYAVAALAALVDKRDTVTPVFGVCESDHAPLVEDFSKYPNIDPSGIFTFPEPTNSVHLYYKDQQTRVECSKNIAPPIPFDRVRRQLDADGILVNMISGFDITIETLDQIRIAIRPRGTPIHLDYHSLTLGVDGRDERYRRPVPDWRRWGFMIDTVQMNEEEIRGLAADAMTEERTAGHLLTLGVKGVLVTRGGRGATVYQNDHKRVVRNDIPGVPVDPVRDTTGCGDVFGAAFHYRFVKTPDLVDAAGYANRTAAARIRLPGSSMLHGLTQGDA